tara:strand:+ start:1938 stop:3095 length:1158 start_codon:yes stop_codon:yes gene_type:complete
MKNILVFSGYRSDYTKLKSVLEAMDNHKHINFKIVVFGAHTLEDCGNSYNDLISDGYEIEQILNTTLIGMGTDVMSKSIGVAMMELSSVISRTKPDATMIVGDRYEIFAAAAASSVNNIPVIHIQGGELSGTIDETLRHSITKLSHLHFPSTEQSAHRIIQMGEDPSNVYNVGCPAIDYILKQEYHEKEEMSKVREYGQYKINFKKSYGIVIQHSVTTEHESSYEKMMITLEALQKYGKQVMLVYPNPDAGAEGIIKAIRKFEAKYKKSSVVVEKVKNLPFRTFLNLLKNSDFIIGNSSSGIRESHIFNIPTINIGSRQENRERTLNIVDVPHNKKAILSALKNVKSFTVSNSLYGDGTAGKQMADIIANTNFKELLQKRFYDVW